MHEAIPITGVIVSGTYADANIKNYSHGMWQSVFDFPFLSSSANHIFDLTVGYPASSILSSSTNSLNAKKINMYNTMAQVLMGHDVTGTILEFDEDGNILAGGNKLKETIFINFSRLLYKDEIKKGSFSIKLGGQTSFSNVFGGGSLLTITDAGAQNDFRVNSPTGEYGILSASTGGAYSGSNGLCGLIFYQAGVAVLTSSVFAAGTQGKLGANAVMDAAGRNFEQMLTGVAITGSADAIRRRIWDISFNNTTELNSTIYMCRLNNNEFNYSANPTYVSSSKINVKNNQNDTPVAYVTTVGLYSADNELLATAKVSEALRKDPTIEIILRVRLDF